jgi:D-hydroxyproline dehydrogenase
MTHPKTALSKTPKTAQVIGCGIVGLNVALALQERGVAVQILEREVGAKPASWGNAGHIATEQVEPLASWANVMSLPKRFYSRGGAAAFPPTAISTWLPFGLRLLRAANTHRFAAAKAALKALIAEALPAWQRRVGVSGLQSMLIERGHLVVWNSAQTADQGLDYWTNADCGAARWSELSELERFELSQITGAPIAGGIRFRGTASVSDPGKLLSALMTSFLTNGGSILQTDASLPTLVNEADLTIVCAGARSGNVMRELGYRVPIIAERGYHIQADDVQWQKPLPPIVFEDRSMVVTSFESGLRATSFVEFSTPDAPADPRKWARLRQHARELGLPFGESPNTWMGARPTLPDYLPAIGRTKRDSRVLYAFGHQHLGLTLAPITAEIVAELAMGDTTKIPLQAFALERF